MSSTLTLSRTTYTKMVNKDGKTVAPNAETFQAAAANADWNSVPGYGLILANQAGAESWPMTAATFILMPKQPPDPVAAAEALKRCRARCDPLANIENQ